MLNMHPDGQQAEASAASMDGSALSVIIRDSGVQMRPALPLTSCIPQVPLADFD